MQWDSREDRAGGSGRPKGPSAMSQERQQERAVEHEESIT